MDSLKVTPDTLEKLDKKHFVTLKEVHECFANRETDVLVVDSRETHRTTPPTQWFLARTNRKRLLKVVFVHDGENVHLKSAYEANQAEMDIFRHKGGSF